MFANLTHQDVNHLGELVIETGDDTLPAGLVSLVLHPQLVQLHGQGLDLLLDLRIRF